MSPTLEPLRDRVLVRLRPQVQTGLIVRVVEKDSVRPADVISVGPEVRDVEVGQGVLVQSLAGQQVGEDILLPETSVLAFLDD